MIYKNRDVHTATNCSDVYVEPEPGYIVLWQAGEPFAGNDQVQITSLDDCNRLIEVLNKLKSECWKAAQ